MGEGREGDWECSDCNNRNYAFRSFCNRCKQPRLIVDSKTHADSKWLPRIGDWICTGCTNNNYASREKCKKCSRPKEIAAMPAIAMPGASLPTYSHYFSRTQGGPEQNMNNGCVGNGAPQQSLPLNSNWSVVRPDRYGVQLSSTWPSGGNYSSGLQLETPSNQLLSVPKGWRDGDWVCSCGFHNYSSREQCKKCNASIQPGPALGTKRLASEEFAHGWDKKRLNAGHMQNHIMPNGQQYDPWMGNTEDLKTGFYTPYASLNAVGVPTSQVPVQFPLTTTTPTLLGKGAKQWRDGDWMCNNCNNHNYASRPNCNRCKIQKGDHQPAVSV